jgi:glycosyltransferase involved in cell wall biosynthesis
LIFNNWKPHIFMTLYDIWMGAYVDPAPPPKLIKPIHPHWIPIVMVDHEPIPEATLTQAAEAFRVVTPTRYGENQFKTHGVHAEYIPFGIDTNVFKPSLDKKEDKAWLQRYSLPFVQGNETDIKEDTFLLCMVGANKDPYRKGFMRAFVALQLFFEYNPEARDNTCLYVHSWMKFARDIPHGAKTLHVEKYCRGTNDYHMLTGASSAEMARVYNAADVLLHPSQGGGFEIPILESLSCGVPVIGSDFIGMTELVKDHGWLVPYIKGESGARSKYFTPLDATQIIIDEFKLAEAIEDAYRHPEKRSELGVAGREFALNFDWNKVNPMWYRLFEEIREEWHTSSLESRLIA